MLKTPIIFALVFLSANAALGQNSAVQKALLKQNAAMVDAYNRRDKAAVLAILNDGYFETEPNGQIFDREKVAARAVNNPVGLKITEKVKVTRLIVAGNTAVLSYRADATMEGAGNKADLPPRQMTTVWIHKGAKWRLMSAHSSTLDTSDGLD